MNVEGQVRYETRRELLKLRAVRTGVEYEPGTTWWPELRGLRSEERVDVRERVRLLHGFITQCEYCRNARLVAGIIYTCGTPSDVYGPCPRYRAAP